MNSLFFGRRQQGKSTLAFHLAQQAGLSIAIFDVNAQFRAWPESTYSNLEDFELALLEGRDHLLIYRPESDPDAEFSICADLLWNRRDYTLLIDEASQLQTAGRPHEKLGRLIRMGDARAVNVFQTLHRPADSATLCRSLAHHWYLFRTTLETDLAVVAERCGMRAAEALQQLGPFEYVHWDDDKQALDVVKNPGAWFVDIHNALPGPGEESDGEALSEVRDAAVAG